MGATRTLVVGAGGLLGSAVTTVGARRGDVEVIAASGIPWDRPADAQRQLADSLRDLVAPGDPWQVLWCAGAGVNGMSQARFDLELEQFALFLAELERSAMSGRGRLFLTSSAGGVYAGAWGAPFRESSPVAPLSPYGVTKLAMEAAVRAFADRSGMRVLIGRLSNLYGPGQNLAKQQGLVSHLCLGAIERRPVSIFVPLDTMRDYLYVTDAAEMIFDAMNVLGGGEAGVALKIFASQQSVTVASLLGVVNASAGTKPRIVLGASPLAAGQGRDIRLRSDVFTGVDERTLTPLAVGVARTWNSLLGLYVGVGRRSG